MTSRKIALVTGGGTGIGTAVAIALAKCGNHVVICGRRPDPLQRVADQITTDGGAATALPADVSRAADVDALFADIRRHFGRLDILFNNAGISAPSIPIDELSVAQWQAVIDTNLTGAFLCARAAFRMMKTQSPRGGRIINNGSISATVPRPFSAPYTSTKHAITGLTKSISLDGRAYDIACGQIDIGNAATEMVKPMQKGILQANGTTAIEPTMDVTHVGDAVAYMAGLPLVANVQFMTLMATTMPYVGRG